jgi:cell division protein FtsX
MFWAASSRYISIIIILFCSGLIWWIQRRLARVWGRQVYDMVYLKQTLRKLKKNNKCRKMLLNIVKRLRRTIRNRKRLYKRLRRQGTLMISEAVGFSPKWVLLIKQ